MAKEKKSHNPAPKNHWELRYSPNKTHDSATVKGTAFNPKRGSERMTTYVKVNKVDH